jgi:hypothetical protein
LKYVGKAAGNKICDYNTSQKPTLESVCYSLVTLFGCQTVVAQESDYHYRQAYGNRISDYHRDGSALYKFKGLRGIVHIRDEYQDHMYYLA